MGLNRIRIAGPDDYCGNNDGSNWKDAVQVSAKACELFKISITNIHGAPLYVWLFDLAQGDDTSSAPVHVRKIPADLADTWDFYTGALFKTGLYVRLSTTAPGGVGDEATPAGDDAGILKIDFHTL